MRFKCEEDRKEVVRYLSGKGRISRADVETKANSKSYSRHVRTFSRPKEVTIAALKKTFETFARMDSETVAEGGLPLLNPEVKKGHQGPLGAKTALNNLIKCVEKGCCQDPYPLDDM